MIQTRRIARRKQTEREKGMLEKFQNVKNKGTEKKQPIMPVILYSVGNKVWAIQLS